MAEDATTDSEWLGRCIQVRRVQLGYKRAELAKRAELSYPYVSEIENGLKTPSTKALRQLAAALKMSPAGLIALADRQGQSVSADVDPDSADLTAPLRLGPTGPSEIPGLPNEGGLSKLMWSRLESDDSDDRKTQILVAAVVRAELAAWARTELPMLVRTALEQALREQGK